jgi:hypothetical protein
MQMLVGALSSMILSSNDLVLQNLGAVVSVDSDDSVVHANCDQGYYFARRSTCAGFSETLSSVPSPYQHASLGRRSSRGGGGGGDCNDAAGDLFDGRRGAAPARPHTYTIDHPPQRQREREPLYGARAEGRTAGAGCRRPAARSAVATRWLRSTGGDDDVASDPSGTSRLSGRLGDTGGLMLVYDSWWCRLMDLRPRSPDPEPEHHVGVCIIVTGRLMSPRPARSRQ